MFDFVCVTYMTEKVLSKLQARSFAKYVREGMVASITVIVNELDAASIDATMAVVEKDILPEFGLHRNKVTIRTSAEFIDPYSPAFDKFRGHDHNPGYYLQQILKLRAAAKHDNEFAIILDAKNFFAREIREQDFVSVDGKKKGHFIDLSCHPAFNKNLASIKSILNMEENPRTFLLAPSTPFAMISGLAADLIVDLEQRHGCTLEALWFQNRYTISEFVLYSLYLEHRGLLDSNYEEWPGLASVLWGSGEISVRQIENTFACLANENVLMTGVHVLALAKMQRPEMLVFEQLLANIGLLEVGETIERLAR